MTYEKSRRAGIPTVRCVHVAYSTQQRCRNPARVGTTLCHMHAGSASHIQRKANERATIAQLMQHEDPDHPRPLGEVMLEAVHNADVIMRSLSDVRLRVLRGEEVELADVDRLLEMSRAAQHLAESTTRAGVQVELVRQASLQTEMNSAVVVRALGAALDVVGRRLRAAGVPEDLLAAVRVEAHAAVSDELRAVEDAPALEDLRRGVTAELEGRPR